MLIPVILNHFAMNVKFESSASNHPFWCHLRMTGIVADDVDSVPLRDRGVHCFESRICIDERDGVWIGGAVIDWLSKADVEDVSNTAYSKLGDK